MPRKKLAKTIRKEIIEELEELHVTPAVFMELLGLDLQKELDALNIQDDDNSAEYSSELFERVSDAFLSRTKELTVIPVDYEALVEEITSTEEDKPYSFTFNNHTISGVGGDEDVLFETDIELDGRSIVAEHIGDNAVDVFTSRNDDIIEFACLNEFEADEIASYFGATLKLEFIGIDNYAKYF